MRLVQPPLRCRSGNRNRLLGRGFGPSSTSRCGDVHRATRHLDPSREVRRATACQPRKADSSAGMGVQDPLPDTTWAAGPSDRSKARHRDELPHRGHQVPQRLGRCTRRDRSSVLKSLRMTASSGTLRRLRSLRRCSGVDEHDRDMGRPGLRSALQAGRQSSMRARRWPPPHATSGAPLPLLGKPLPSPRDQGRNFAARASQRCAFNAAVAPSGPSAPTKIAPSSAKAVSSKPLVAATSPQGGALIRRLQAPGSCAMRTALAQMPTSCSQPRASRASATFEVNKEEEMDVGPGHDANAGAVLGGLIAAASVRAPATVRFYPISEARRGGEQERDRLGGDDVHAVGRLDRRGRRRCRCAPASPERDREWPRHGARRGSRASSSCQHPARAPARVEPPRRG